MTKRRTIDASKLRRPTKRSRITDSVNGSWLLYLRFFIVWLLIITVDFALEFRVEFLWPFWLLIRSSFDSFRYQGMALTLLFLCVTLLSDIVCFMFLPVHWLFFVASTYVWVQFVITTERGPCLATVSLWLLFVYVEASVRLREIKSLPFNLDICRPFAAHCIGYPVVSLGYGFKSYVGYKVKSYRKCEVSKQNYFYQQLVTYALPVEVQNLYNELQVKNSTSISNGLDTLLDSSRSNGSCNSNKKGHKLGENDEKQATSSLSLNDLETVSSIPSKDSKHNKHEHYESSNSGFVRVIRSSSSSNTPNGGSYSNKMNGDIGLSNTLSASSANNKRSSKNHKQPHKPTATVDSDYELDISDSEASTSSSRLSHDNSPKTNRNNTSNCNTNSSSTSNSSTVHASVVDQLQGKLKDEQLARRKCEQQFCQLEFDLKRLRSDLHTARQIECEFRTQVSANSINERHFKCEIDQLNANNEALLQKISTFNSNKTQDKTLITTLERKLKNERDARSQLENQLKESKKKIAAAAAIPPPSLPPQVEKVVSAADHDSCKVRTAELEGELKRIQAKFEEASKRLDAMKKEEETTRKSNSTDNEKMKKDLELLSNAFKVMQGKNLHLENSLSSETRLKLDLFSALGDTRRQLEITQDRMHNKCKEVDMLKGKIAEVMAVMPPQYHSSIGGGSFGGGGGTESKAAFITKNLDPVVVSSTNGLA